MSEFLNEQPGFLYRSLSKKEDHTYVDIVYWENQEFAKQASDAIMKDVRGKAMSALCDMDSVSMLHLPVLDETMSASCESAA